MASRSVKPSDYDAIEAAFVDGVLALDGLKPFCRAMDPHKAAHYLAHEHEHSYIVDETFLVCYQIGTPWFSNEQMLGEMSVLRLAAGGSFSMVTDFLKAEAKRHSCKWVLTGTLLSNCDELLSRLYTMKGFSPTLRQLAMEVT